MSKVDVITERTDAVDRALRWVDTKVVAGLRI